MGQNNDTTEHGDLQGNQGGNLSKDPKQHERLRQPEEGFARAERFPTPLLPESRRQDTSAKQQRTSQREPGREGGATQGHQ